jgi:hypothetical protein
MGLLCGWPIGAEYVTASKRRQTAAKRQREYALQEKRARKQAKREARRAKEAGAPSADVAAEVTGDPTAPTD